MSSRESDLAQRELVVGVAAHLGREVEGHREPGLAVLYEVLEAGVGLHGGPEARVLAHGPWSATVHARVHAPRVRKLPGIRQPLGVLEVLAQVLGSVDRLYLDAGLRAAFVYVHGTSLIAPCPTILLAR
jgi:hypothetical protein